MTKEVVLSCMGIPWHKAHEGDTTVWSYHATDGSSATNKFSNSGYTYSTRARNFCTVDIVMNKGLVTKVNYSGPTGGIFTENEQCGYAVKNCVE